MKLITMLLLTSVSFIVTAQEESNGIKFEHGVSWNQVKMKAKAENKYIFVDCFATWCGPCKLMDETVFPLKKVGDYFNRKFISVRVQMDTTLQDNPFIRSWLQDAVTIRSRYAISSYPTFLFFSPQGKPLHKVSGGVTADGLIALAEDAQDSTKQYYQVLKNFQPGKLDITEMKGLAYSFKFSDKELANKIAVDYLARIPFGELGMDANLSFMVDFQESSFVLKKAMEYVYSLDDKELPTKKNVSFLNGFKKQEQVQDLVAKYISKLKEEQLHQREVINLLIAFHDQPGIAATGNNYVDHLKESELYEIDNIKLMAALMKSSKEKCFLFFSQHSKKIDATIGIKGYAERFTGKIITREAITPFINEAIKKETNPDWTKLESLIEGQYGEGYAIKNVLLAKPAYYLWKKDSVNYTKWLAETVDFVIKNQQPGALYLNNVASDIVDYNGNHRELKRALRWINKATEMDTAISSSPFAIGYLDTKADILFKLGKVQSAIALEEKVVSSSPQKQYFDKLHRMQKQGYSQIENLR